MQSKFLNVSDLPLTTRCSTGEEPHLPPGVRTGAPGFLPRPKHQRRPDATCRNLARDIITSALILSLASIPSAAGRNGPFVWHQGRCGVGLIRPP